MTQPSPRERLAGALETAAHKLPHGLGAIAKRAGVSTRVIANAAAGRPVAVIPYLRIAAAIGYDPCPELAHAMIEPSDFDPWFLGMAVRIRRCLNYHTFDEAGAAMGSHPRTVEALERGQAFLIGVTLKACRYVGVHPFGYCGIPRAAIAA